MNSLLLVSLLVAAASAGNVIYGPGYHGFGYGFGYGLHPYGYAGHGLPLAYGAFPGYGYGLHHPFGYPALVAAKPAEEEEPAAEEGDRKKRDAPVVAHHVPAYPYALPYAFPYAHHPYAFPAVVKAEAPKVEVKKVVHTLPAPYAAYPAAYPYGFGLYHGLPYVKLAKKEEEPAAEEGSRKKRQVLLAPPFGLHHPIVYSAPVIKPVEVEHKYKTVHLETEPEADTPADTTLVGLKEKEHTFKTAHYPAVYPAPYAHFPLVHPVVKVEKKD